MTLFKQLLVRPWEDAGISDAAARFPDLSGQSNKRLALKVFLGVVSVVFTLLVVAYAGRMSYEDWRPVPQIGLMWANTGFLLLGSLSLELARYGTQRKNNTLLNRGLLGCGLFTVVFLVGQFRAAQELASIEYFSVTNPAIAFFYLLTALHGLHLVVGLVVWGRVLRDLWFAFEPAKVRHSVALCAIYWHWLFLIWLALFGLLFTGNNLDLLLTICGIR